MERLTTFINGDVYYSKGEYAPTTLCAEMSTSEIRECMHSLAVYEDTGLTPEEVARLHTLIKQQGEELQRRDLLIKELDKERDYWEREAKKWCIELGKIREDAAKELCD